MKATIIITLLADPALTAAMVCLLISVEIGCVDSNSKLYGVDFVLHVSCIVCAFCCEGPLEERAKKQGLNLVPNPRNVQAISTNIILAWSEHGLKATMMRFVTRSNPIFGPRRYTAYHAVKYRPSTVLCTKFEVSNYLCTRHQFKIFFAPPSLMMQMCKFRLPNYNSQTNTQLQFTNSELLHSIFDRLMLVQYKPVPILCIISRDSSRWSSEKEVCVCVSLIIQLNQRFLNVSIDHEGNRTGDISPSRV